MKIVSATYIEGYKMHFTMDDNTNTIVDFESFIFSNKNPMNTQFRDVALFSTGFVIEENGIISWNGPDGEMDFDADHLIGIVKSGNSAHINKQHTELTD